MQTKNVGSVKVVFCAKLLMLSMLCGLAGCERDAGASGTAGKSLASSPAPASAGARAYTFVTQTRPESPDTFVNVEKAAYELCVFAAQQAKLPVVPFVKLPADFVSERITYQTNGTNYHYKKQSYAVDIDTIRPERGCAVHRGTHTMIERVIGDTVEHLDIDKDGKRYPKTLDAPRFASELQRDISKYSVARTENGIAMHCLAPANLVPGIISASCIVDDGSGGTLRDVDGRALDAFTRMEGMSNQIGITRLEPVSLQIGKFDPAVFTGELK